MDSSLLNKSLILLSFKSQVFVESIRHLSERETLGSRLADYQDSPLISYYLCIFT